MAQHRVSIDWRRTSPGFAYEDYNREHEWLTGSGQRIQASAAAQFLGDGRSVDPEEAFVGAISACHMLTFLAICARKRIIVDRYRDEAVGYLEKNASGRLSVTRVELAPRIEFAGETPGDTILEGIHHSSHQECFIANSVRTEITLTRLR